MQSLGMQHAPRLGKCGQCSEKGLRENNTGSTGQGYEDKNRMMSREAVDRRGVWFIR